MSDVSFDQVTFAYRPQDGLEPGESVTALTCVSHDFPRGSATLLTGPSGCGKSTLLRLANGLIPHVTHGHLTGRVTVDGLDPSRHRLVDVGRRTATIFQNPRNQFFAATVGEELAFARQQAGEPLEVIRAAVAQAAQTLGMSAWLSRSLHQMSGGELQRVACGTALTSPATIVLFDEPTSNLSTESIAEIARIMRLMKQAGATLIIAEHRVYFLRDIVDTVLTMDAGRIERVWDAEEFFSLGDDERRHRGIRTLVPPCLEARETDPTGPPRCGLTLSNVTFSYGKRKVLDIPHLNLPAGTVSAIMGANGVGKSTLCRIVTGLAEAGRHASITWNGREVNRRARLAMSSFVMQDVHRQLFSASVTDEVMVGTRSRPGADVTALLSRLGLSDLADRHPMSLSGGQKQRLVIASALADDACVVVFDEPTSGVDQRHLVDIVALIRSLARSGVAVVVVSHDLEFVNACADHVVTLDGPHPSKVRTSTLRRDSM